MDSLGSHIPSTSSVYDGVEESLSRAFERVAIQRRAIDLQIAGEQPLPGQRKLSPPRLGRQCGHRTTALAGARPFNFFDTSVGPSPHILRDFASTTGKRSVQGNLLSLCRRLPYLLMGSFADVICRMLAHGAQHGSCGTTLTRRKMLDFRRRPREIQPRSVLNRGFLDVDQAVMLQFSQHGQYGPRNRTHLSLDVMRLCKGRSSLLIDEHIREPERLVERAPIRGASDFRGTRES